jgi:hypothetical protein
MVFLIGTSTESARAIAHNFGEKIKQNNENRHRKYHPPIHFCIVPYDPAYNHIFDNILAQATDFLNVVKAKSEDNALCINC